jgi:hypothetical protein
MKGLTFLKNSSSNCSTFLSGVGFYTARTQACPIIRFLWRAEIVGSEHSKGKGKGKAVPYTGLGWPRGFQEVKVPRLHDNSTGWL